MLNEDGQNFILKPEIFANLNSTSVNKYTAFVFFLKTCFFFNFGLMQVYKEYQLLNNVV